MLYKGILNQDREALTLADDVNRGVYSNDPAFFLSDLESWFKQRAAKAIRDVSVYENDDQESTGIAVYMRCLEAVGVDVSAEAEQVRQVLRNAITPNH